LRGFWVTRVPSDVPRVTFLLKFRNVRGIGSSESTRFPEGLVDGNSGKPVTLETSRLMKFVMQVFRGKELTKIWSPELTKSRSRECAVDWTPELSKPRNRERAMAQNFEPAKP
jgi:hypothetical protein